MLWKGFILVSLLRSLPLAAASPKKHAKDANSNGASLSATNTSMTATNTSMPAPTVHAHNMSQVHTPFTGTATTTGALTASSIGTTITSLGLAPNATGYPADGKLHDPEPAAFVPAGGVGTNGTEPVYNTRSDFDYQSLALALYQEWIELDLFEDGLRRFNESEFLAAGLTSADRELISFMAEQEIGHATMLSNILGAQAPQQCSYIYPYTNVREFIDFCQKLTRFGEASVYGFLPHLNSREAATLVTQTVTVEARQQLIFRQFETLFPMVEWFEVGVPQSWAWTLLAPYISSCPENQTRLIWQNFPALMIVNQPNPWNSGFSPMNSTSKTNRTSSSSNATSSIDHTLGFNQTEGFAFNQSTGVNETVGPGLSVPKSPNGSGKFNMTSSGTNMTSSGTNMSSPETNMTICGASVSKIRSTPLTSAGRQVLLQWDLPGKKIGPNNSYITTTNTSAGSAKFVAWVSQLNITYTPLHIVNAVNATSGLNFTKSINATDGHNDTAAVNSTLSGMRGYTIQPDMEVYEGHPAFNGTIFVAITDSDPFLTPFNVSLINPHVVAGPALYQAG
ncbi:uncharacterized protein N7515_009445 [Penicillium bovifimosum]|uniref:Stress response protein Rds1 n=1 Tax=Penicillium bovifimosum TaxID=126998 RepID=A0A9W9GKE7_9EURO|nr:uncharacterized protein N7515_009445 [Penicillium bovifimosum]KAJ5121484.1 hypothetical protein N7515_009445 [Penicillium bovifimosum]